MGQIYEIRYSGPATKPGLPRTIREIELGGEFPAKIWNCREEVEANDILIFEADSTTTWPFRRASNNSYSLPASADDMEWKTVCASTLSAMRFPTAVKAIYRLPHLHRTQSLQAAFMNSQAKYLPTLNCSNLCTDIGAMCCNAKNLVEADLSLMDTSNVTAMYQVFNGCTSLERVNLDGLDTSKVKSLGLFFADSAIRDVNLDGFDTRNCESLSSFFADCPNIQFVIIRGELFDTGKVKIFDGFACRCSSLRAVDLRTFRTSPEGGVSCYGMFSNSPNLQDIMFEDFDMSNVSNVDSMFANCTALRNLRGLTNFVKSIDFGYCPNLSRDSVGLIFDELSYVDEPQTLTLNGGVKDKVSDEQLATATAKGWTVIFVGSASDEPL